MKTKLKFLSLTTMLALVSCGGTDTQDSTLRQSFTTQILADSNTTPISTDLVVNSFVSKPGIGKHSFDIQVTDTSADAVDIDNLSFALEYSRTTDFNRVYRTALYDLHTIQQADNTATITARSKLPGLPSGPYTARLVVNPDWHMYIENSLQANDLSQSMHYIAESNYTNNFSESFNVQIEADIQCTEDINEGDNSFQSATVLNSKATISASLCEDNADLFALPMQANQTSVLSFKYDGAHGATPTQYTLISDDFYRDETGALEGPENQVQFTAAVTGTYYLAIFGTRANYTISRDIRTALATDWFFSTDTAAGPTSAVYGPVTLNRLNFNVADLVNKTVHCRRQVIDPLRPDSYTTPPHFPGIHEFRFLDNNTYLLDSTTRNQWSVVTGDISNDDWYQNSYHGWAENLYDGGWRYWDFSGESYVECALK